MFRQSFFSMVSPPSRTSSPVAERAEPQTSSRVDPMKGFAPSRPPLDLTPEGERLTPFGARWLQELPVPVRPAITARRHPHIINRLALLKNDRRAREEYFDSLFISSRPNRRGFAFEVLEELVELQKAFQEGRIG